MKTSRDQIWDMVADLLPQGFVEQVLPVRYEGIKKWEDEVKDIVDAVESLAMAIEHAEQERWEAEHEGGI